MTTSDSYFHVPARGRGITLCLRIAILVIDFATIIALSVSLGLHHKWVPATSYPTTALHPANHTDWTDPIVLVAVLISFTWTCFITIRSAWTSKSLHLGYCVIFEFAVLVWLLACTIPAFMLRGSSVKNIIAVSDNCSNGTVTLANGDKTPWVCESHLHTLKKLQIASYSEACVVAVFHFTLFALACHSLTKPPQDRPQTPQQIDNGPTPKTAQEDQDSTAERSESTSASGPGLFEIA